MTRRSTTRSPHTHTSSAVTSTRRAAQPQLRDRLALRGRPGGPSMRLAVCFPMADVVAGGEGDVNAAC